MKILKMIKVVKTVLCAFNIHIDWHIRDIRDLFSMRDIHNIREYQRALRKL